MTTSLLADAFGHHVWATLTLFDSLADLTPEQMETSVPGTYGSIRETVQHLVGADCSYLFVIGGGTRPRIDEETMDLAALRAEMEANGPAWTEVLDEEIDPEEMPPGPRRRVNLAGAQGDPAGPGAPPRDRPFSQICTALTQLGIEPPLIDVWDYGFHENRLVETPPTPRPQPKPEPARIRSPSAESAGTEIRPPARWPPRKHVERLSRFACLRYGRRTSPRSSTPTSIRFSPTPGGGPHSSRTPRTPWPRRTSWPGVASPSCRPMRRVSGLRLFGVAYRVIANQRRAAGRRLQLTERLKLALVPPSRPPAALADVTEALATLSDGDQEILRLAAWEGLSHAEIGQVLAITPNAAAIRLHRARRRLEGALKGSAPTRTFMRWRGSVSSTQSGEESE